MSDPLLARAQHLYLAGRLDQAHAAFAALAARAPRDADAWQGLALVAQARGALAEADAHYACAIDCAPDAFEFVVQRAALLQALGRFDAARALWLDATRRFPHEPQAFEGLGIVEQALGAAHAARAAYAQSCALAPTAARRLKAGGVISPIPEALESIEAERATLEATLDALLRDPPPPLSDPMREALWPHFYLAFHGRGDKVLQQKAARVYAALFPSLSFVAPHCRAPRRPGRLRVGLISKFFMNHSIGRTSRGFFAALPRERLELAAIFVAPYVDDDYSRAIRAGAERAIVVPQDLSAARAQIAALELDVLFYQDIGMEPFAHFLAFARLAPVQCVSFGHPDTTGIPTLDWFVSSELFEPAHADAHYSERLFALRGLGTLAYYFEPPRQPRAKSRADFGFDADAHLYLCPQNLFKIHPELDALFGAILRGDPRGRIVLVEARLAAWNARLSARLQRAIPDVADRVVFVPRMDSADYIDLIACADVMLDTIHFNGMNTSLEAFAVGTPVVTWPREFQRGRHTHGMYQRMGIVDGTVARTGEEYVALALALGTDPAHRRAIAQRIVERKHLLFEDRAVLAEFERFFLEASAAAVATP